jgi:hypothetical protein
MKFYPKLAISKGNFLILLPVAAKIALPKAGAIGGKLGSPTRTKLRHLRN